MSFSPVAHVPNVTLDAIIQALRLTEEQQTYRKIDYFTAYPKQQEFFDDSLTYRERLLMAGNQVGKTYAGAFELTCHLTGEYPDWWLGRRFDCPIKAWACGESSLVVRDVQQKLLCGEPGVDSLLGTGMIPKEAFADKPSLARGVTDAYDTVQVKHKSGGISILRFKSYEQGRTKFQGESIDVGWCDEEPDADVYSEILTRITATNGTVYMTFTPLKGMSEVVRRFRDEISPDRSVTTMTIEDAKHIPADKRAAIVAGYREFERDARARGIPMLGSGLIYQFSIAQIGEPTIEVIPPHWSKLWSIDFGIGDEHKFAATLHGWDRDADIIHILHAFSMKGALPMAHAAAMLPIGANVPVAWPHDGNNRDKGSGNVLATVYKTQGLKMLSEHATFPEGGYSPEAGVMEIQQRMETGRFKVGLHLSSWFDEQRQYHRKDGLIVKSHDDIMDSTRIGVMAKRYGQMVSLGSHRSRRRVSTQAEGVEFDLS